VSLIGGTGWYVWNASNKANKNLDNATKSTQSMPIPSKKKTQSITIREWGVRGKYSENLTLKYKLLEGSDPPEAANFTSTELDDSGPICKQGGDYGGAVERYKSTDHYLIGDDGEDSGKTAAQFATTIDKKFYAHLGDYYYFKRGAQAACSDSKTSQDLQGQTQDAVLEVLASLEVNSAQ
jgi:hypothetical protein